MPGVARTRAGYANRHAIGRGRTRRGAGRLLPQAAGPDPAGQAGPASGLHDLARRRQGGVPPVFRRRRPRDGVVGPRPSRRAGAARVRPATGWRRRDRPAPRGTGQAGAGPRARRGRGELLDRPGGVPGGLRGRGEAACGRPREGRSPAALGRRAGVLSTARPNRPARGLRGQSCSPRHRYRRRGSGARRRGGSRHLVGPRRVRGCRGDGPPGGFLVVSGRQSDRRRAARRARRAGVAHPRRRRSRRDAQGGSVPGGRDEERQCQPARPGPRRGAVGGGVGPVELRVSRSGRLGRGQAAHALGAVARSAGDPDPDRRRRWRHRPGPRGPRRGLGRARARLAGMDGGRPIGEHGRRRGHPPVGGGRRSRHASRAAGSPARPRGPGRGVRGLRGPDRGARAAVVSPRPMFFLAGARELRSAVLVPGGLEPEASLPVLLDPYGGPGFQRVLRARDEYLESQWLADQGLAVLIVDGRGTPGRGLAWEREIRGDMIGPTLEDQVDALHAAAERFGFLDLRRVAIRGWSFGGELATAAVLRRPDVFHAAIAGAPATDPRLYDTHYTERYYGHPDEDPEAYRRGSLLEEAGAPRRPLLVIHGPADDNVFVANALRVSRAFLEAGRPPLFLPLSGASHMAKELAVAENLLRLELQFLRTTLGLDD